jgi:2-keto-4-pentenoate hydratase/2-oxohepta-3-ene-1,7-dioic acid hydratase in catechol pathway
MKLLSFEQGGRAGYGAVKGDGIVDLGKRLKHPTLRALLAAGALDEARKTVDQASADLPLKGITYLSPIPEPGKILAIGLNYAAHAAEGGSPVPPKPIVFTRFPDSLVGHEQSILRPRESEAFDWEVELVVVMGKTARRVAAKDALAHVAGYTVMNEGCLRDWQRHSPVIIPGKNFYRSGAIGPWIVTADEIPNPSGLRLTTKLNGKTMQDSTTADLIFDVGQLIEYISAFTPLGPGDMIATGTPQGVGVSRKPPVFLKVGDKLEQEIEKIGVLRCSVIDD